MYTHIYVHVHSLRMYVYTYLHTLSICMYIYIYNVYIYTHTYIHVYVYIYIYIYICTHMYIYVYVTYMYIHICIYAYMYLYICVHIHVYIYVSMSLLWVIYSSMSVSLAGLWFECIYTLLWMHIHAPLNVYTRSFECTYSPFIVYRGSLVGRLLQDVSLCCRCLFRMYVLQRASRYMTRSTCEALSL